MWFALIILWPILMYYLFYTLVVIKKIYWYKSYYKFNYARIFIALGGISYFTIIVVYAVLPGLSEWITLFLCVPLYKLLFWHYNWYTKEYAVNVFDDKNFGFEIYIYIIATIWLTILLLLVIPIETLICTYTPPCIFNLAMYQFVYKPNKHMFPKHKHAKKREMLFDYYVMSCFIGTLFFTLLFLCISMQIF